LFEHDLFGKPVTTFPDHALDNDFSQRRLLRAILDIDANKLLPAVRKLLTTQTKEILWLLGREPINLPGGRLARVRHAPIATNFRSATK
jgi:hypothetical protein